jgi:hypothetical protein
MRCIAATLVLLPVALSQMLVTSRPEPRVDEHGEPLPGGAIVRLGTPRAWTGAVHAVALSPDGKTAAIGRGKTVEFWDTVTGMRQRTLQELRSEVRSLVFSPDGVTLACAEKPSWIETDDNLGKSAIIHRSAVYVWHVADGTLERTLDTGGRSGPVIYSGDGKYLMVANEEFLRWDTGTWKTVPLPNVKSVQSLLVRGGLWSSAITADGRTAAVVADGPKVFVANLSTGDVREFPAEAGNYPLVLLTANGTLAATAGGNSLRLWEVATGEEKKLFDSPYTEYALFAPHRMLLAWVRRNAVYLGDVTTGKMTRPLRGHELGIRCLAFSGDAQLLATGSDDGSVLIWDVRKQELLDPGVVTAEQSTGKYQKQPAEVPADARVSIILPRKVYFLGESITAQFCVENVGKGLIQISTGGDYRFASRHLRFHVTAADDQGTQVVDPDPSQFCMGGLGSEGPHYPGKKECMEVPLLAYCRFDKPGTYTVRISHDLGWHGTEERPLPVAECVLHLKRPSPAQAKGVIDALAAGDKSGFHYLRDLVYLPILLKAAQDGDEHALAGIGSIAKPEATQALVRLASQVPEKASWVSCKRSMNDCPTHNPRINCLVAISS